ncbi:LLM class flavin-dependent oxidoreductase [Streptomyces flavochromogenes]|uniref:LLM class flavin-dependent oxidoreductase n=1 Tax=Streptomyces flavochromogenes TaxID=68199 RepID=A0ABW6XY77_9ACTN
MPASPTALDRLVSPDGRPTLGLELPLDNDWGATRLRTDQAAGRPFGVPDLTEHARLARLADSLGFAALWVRDVPLHDPEHFGDAGSVFETFTHLGHLAAVTERAVLGTAAVVLPLRQPLLVAKAATVDVLSGGRFVLGLASGDRPVEYPLSSERTSTLVDGLSATTSGPARRLGHARAWRGTRAALPRSRRRPTARRPARAHRPDGPACHRRKRPADAEWVAENAEASLDHPRPLGALGLRTREWRALTIGSAPKPYLTPMQRDLPANPDTPAAAISLGLRTGRHALRDRLRRMGVLGVAHVSFTLRPGNRPVEDLLHELAETVLPEFPSR